MNKVAIFTLQGLTNYGNRLQNYAVEHIMEKYSLTPESLILSHHPFLKYTKDKIIYTLLPFAPFVKKSEWKRKKLFYRFNHDYLKIRYYNVAKLSSIDKKYKYCISGGDQVWNPEFNKSGLYFIRESKNKISLSASIGVSAISDSEAAFLQQGLSSFKKISVREIAGQEMIQKLINKSVDRLFDPTMYLTVNEWKQIEKKPRNFLDTKYIFSYVLGHNYIHDDQSLKQIEKELNCKVYNLYEDGRTNKDIVGPREFLWLIRHSCFVLTDSYHAAVFSIIFHTPFLIFNRKDAYNDMSSRYDTLLKVFGFSEKIYTKGEKITLSDYNFEKSDNIINIERRRMDNFLSSIFNV